MDTDKVDSGGVQIYRLERDDAWLDRFFGETGYVRDCSGNDQRKSVTIRQTPCGYCIDGQAVGDALAN